MHVIICGFTYGSLGYVKVDLIRMLNWANKRKWTVTILTDNLQVDPEKMWIGYRDGLLPTYYETTPLPQVKRIANQDDLTRYLNSLRVAKRTLFYYSGHAEEQGIRMPNQQIFKYVTLKEHLSRITRRELFGFFDCCHSPNFELRWKLNIQGSSRDKTARISELGANGVRITILSSSDPDEEAAASHYGSYLTRVFVEQVDQIVELPKFLAKCQEWVTLQNFQGTAPKLQRKRETQTVNLYSNHKRAMFMPMMLFGLRGPSYVDC
jgi:hypothetical protein